jgi:hypothetical protein
MMIVKTPDGGWSIEYQGWNRVAVTPPIYPSHTLEQWRMFSYAGFTNNRKCPNANGGCRGSISLFTESVEVKETRRMVLVRRIDCNRCGANLSKFVMDKKTFVVGKEVVLTVPLSQQTLPQVATAGVV